MIAFHFDFLSPYAYLAWKALPALAQKHRQPITPEPTVLAVLLRTYGHKGPAEIPPKRLYLYKHIVRMTRELGVTMTPPPVHPWHPLLPLRAVSVEMPAEQRTRAIDALFDYAWGNGRGLHTSELVKQALGEAELDADALVAAASTEPIKQRLRASTQRGLDAGAFGVPTMIVNGELFWGYDSLAHIDAFLSGRDPITAAELAKWNEAAKNGVWRS